MKFLCAHIYALRIPFKNPFAHFLQQREHSESVVVSLTAEDGTIGYGEGLPRPYVSGETVSSCIGRIKDYLLPEVSQIDIPGTSSDNELTQIVYELAAALPVARGDGAVHWTAARSAVELALIDCLLKQQKRSAALILPPKVEAVKYSAVITGESLDVVRKVSSQCKKFGMQHIKVKVTGKDDFARVAAVREVVGDGVSIRVDANGAFDVQQALSLIRILQPLRIDCIEQPVPRGDLQALIEIRKNSSVPVMVDESVVTVDDAENLIEHQACDLFNLRISKNGGLLPVLQISGKALSAGIGLQLGCQVGETAILSAAGRHLAAHLPGLRFVEGSYGTLLLEEDIAEETVEFGQGGYGQLLGGDGLGVHVHEDQLRKYAESEISVRLC